MTRRGGRMMAALRSRAGAVASSTTLALAAGGFVAVAVLSPGLTAATMSLHDGGVWVSRPSAGGAGVGEVVPRIRQIGMEVAAPALKGFALLQDGSDVLLAAPGAPGTLRRVEASTRRLGSDAVPLPKGAHVDLAGGVLAVVGQDGALWARPASQATGLPFEGRTGRLATLSPGAAIAVGTDGTVVAADPRTRRVTRYARDARGFREVESFSLAGPLADPAQITLVGGTPAVLLAQGRVQVGPSEPVAVPGASDAAVLQQPGPQASAVVIATDDSLVAVPLGGGRPTVLAASGTGDPGAPVQAGGCVYGVWSGKPWLSTVCDGGTETAQRVGGPVTPGKPRPSLVLRVNRGLVVVNDVATGDAYWTDDPGRPIDWTTQRTVTRRVDVKVVSPVESTEFADRAKPNTPPQPQDDDFGVRPGVPRELPVLRNDRDADGDVLTVAAVTDPPAASFGAVQVIKGGRALAFTPAPGVRSGARTFEVLVDDGRSNGRKPSQVVVTVTPSGQNRPPALAGPAARLRVPTQGETSFDLLQDWDDEDGDPLTLTCTTRVERMRCRPDGVVTFSDPATPRTVELAYTVSDGRLTAQGRTTVTVEGPSDGAVLARPDFVTGVVGRPVVVDVLANDTFFRSGARSLDPDVKVYGSDVTRTLLADGRLQLVGTKADTTYLRYSVTQGATRTEGLVRFVATEPGKGQAPGAAPDSVLLPANQPMDVDVLANDDDPDGDVLVVTAASTSDALASSLSVAVVDNHTVRLSATEGLPPVAAIPYTISDGTHTVTGAMVVHRLPEGTADEEPVTGPDEADAVAGQVVSVPVLDNDADPEGQPLTLAGDLTDIRFEAAAGGKAVVPQLSVQGRDVQVLAPGEEGEVRATYTALDAAGQRTPGELRVAVHAPSGRNRAPLAPQVSARAVAGSTVRVTVPTAGLDPDGDAVRLTAVTGQGRLGVATLDGTAADTFTYTPRPDGAGQDAVELQVEDDRGATTRFTASIGVAPAGASAAGPVAIGDRVVVRDDKARSFRVPVLANDVAPPGTSLKLVPGGVTGTRLRASAEGDDVRVDVPAAAEPPLLVTYKATAGGQQVDGLLQVDASPQAPLLAPVAGTDVARGAVGSTVPVDALRNDGDPDGSPGGLTLLTAPGAVGPPGTVAVEAGRLAVTVGKVPSWGWYKVRDGEGLETTGFVRVVPDDGAPRLRTGLAPVQLTGRTPVQVRIADVVEVPGGGTATIVEPGPSASGVEVTGTGPGGFTVVPVVERGAAAVTVHVRAPSGANSWVTVPMTVRSTTDAAPGVRQQSLTVALEESATVDLERLVSDDAGDAGRHRFELTGKPGAAGVSASLDGSRLTVKASSDAKPATSGRIGFTVTDGKHPAVPGAVLFRVTQTNRPPPRAADCPATGDLLTPGSSFTVDLASCAVNPFPGSALSIDVKPAQEVTVAPDGTRVTIGIPSTFSGRLSVPYTVTDKVGRKATGRITARVISKPGAPGTPKVVGYASATSVTLTWKAASNGGGVISSYVVTETDSGRTKLCPTTRCTFDGLTSGASYSFTVKASNAAGEGPASPATTVTADAPPGAPTNLVSSSADRAVKATWRMSSAGSPITTAIVYLNGKKVRTLPMPPKATSGSVVLGESDGVQMFTGCCEYVISVALRNAAGTGPRADSAPVLSGSKPYVDHVEIVAYAGGRMAVDVLGESGNQPSFSRAVVTISGTGISGNDCPSADFTVDGGVVFNATCQFFGVPGNSYEATVSLTNSIGTTVQTSGLVTATP